MGFDIRLEDAQGAPIDEIGDPTNLLARLLPSSKDESFVVLRSLDPYGDSAFDPGQSDSLLVELRRVRAKALTQREFDLLDKIIALAERCRLDSRLRLKFYGD